MKSLMWKRGKRAGDLLRFDRVVASCNDPAAVHLEADELRVGALEKFVEEDDAVFACELDGVIVVAERHSRCAHFLADGVELVGDVAPVIEVQLAGSRGIAMDTGPRADDVLEAERLAVFDELAQLRFQFCERVVSADALEPGLLKGITEVRCGLAEIASGFDFFVTGLGEPVEGSMEVFRQEVADRIELQANGLLEGGCGEGVDADERGGGNGAGRLEECAARAGIHMCVSPREPGIFCAAASRRAALLARQE